MQRRQLVRSGAEGDRAWRRLGTSSLAAAQLRVADRAGRAGDAERAAGLWRRGSGRSIADRICMATALRLEAHVWTADKAWGTSEGISQVR